MEALRIKDLSYRYPDGTLALEEVSLSIKRGESIAILGPNGAGKSTLLLLISNVLKPKKGRIELFGEDTRNSSRELMKKLGILLQDADDQLFMPTVFDDVAFGPINLGFKKEVVREKVKEALEVVGLSGFEERYPHHLSFGEKRKVCIAGVLAMDSEILILDEPTSNLDPLSRHELIELLRKLNKAGKTTVIVTHDVRVAAETGERIYILNKTIVLEGKTREIFSYPKILREQNLDVPEVISLVNYLHRFGFKLDGFPLSVEEAAGQIREMLEKTIK